MVTTADGLIKTIMIGKLVLRINHNHKTKIFHNSEISTISLMKYIYANKYFILSISFFFIILSVIITLCLDNRYKVHCKIKAADPSPLSLPGVIPSSLSGFSLTGDKMSPVVEEILFSLKSKDFLKIIMNKYIDSTQVFYDIVTDIKNSSLSEVAKKEKLFAKSYDHLVKDVISTEILDPSTIIDISVELKDKYYAITFLKDILNQLKMYIVKKNKEILQKDIEYYTKSLNEIESPTIKKEIQKIMSDKIQRQVILSNNVFSIYEEPHVPYLKSFPKRSIICLASGILGLIFACGILLSIAIVSKLKQIIS